MTEQELRSEIARLAPDAEVLQVGCLFSNDLDAIIQTAWGQFRWSRYGEKRLIAPATSEALPGQRSLF